MLLPSFPSERSIKMVQPTENFNSIRVMLNKLDFVAGSFILQEGKKKTWNDWAPVVFFVFAFLLSLVFAFGTIMQRQLILYILEVILKLVFNCIFITFGILNYNKTTVHKLLDWCSELYNPENYSAMFGESTYRIARKHIRIVHRRANSMLKWATIILHADTTIATLGVGGLLLLVPGTMHEKYKLPVPYYLPFEDQKTFGHYIITIFGQFICGTSLSCAASLVVGLFCVSFCTLYLISTLSMKL